ncbi:MAG: hypothetical protein Q8R40_02025 [bacterium]|nr:hypothetical protein [bacterium]
MNQHGERVVQFFREKIGEFHRKRYSEHDLSAHLNFYDMLVELEKENSDTVSLLTQLLHDSQAHDVHYWIFITLRSLGSRGRLSYDLAKEVLNATERFAVWDYEEWFKSVGELARTPDGVRVLLEFIEHKLLEERSIRNWRWLAFFTAANIMESRCMSIPDSLKQRLKDEVDQESDPDTRKYIQEVAVNL